MRVILSGLLGLVLASSVHAAAPRLVTPYNELRRALDDAGQNALTAIELSTRGRDRTASVPSPDLQAQLEALCGRDGAYWAAFGREVAERTQPVAVVSGVRTNESRIGDNGRQLVMERYAEMLPNQLRTLADTMPPEGRALFLRPGERLKPRPADLGYAIRQRAEWLVVLNGVTADLERARLNSPGAFNPTMALGVWTELKCELAQGSAPLLEAQLALGYPGATAGPDTESAFLLLVGASGQPELARQALVAAETSGASRTAQDALARWSQQPVRQP